VISTNIKRKFAKLIRRGGIVDIALNKTNRSTKLVTNYVFIHRFQGKQVLRREPHSPLCQEAIRIHQVSRVL
jgi:hypothetical protein